MITVILLGITTGVLYTMGYRLDTKDGSIAQGGLLQIATLPPGARVVMDNRQLSGTTPMRVDAQAGSHTILVSSDGYRPWQKTVTVDPGMVHWSNYIRLMPIRPVEQTKLSFDTLAAVLPADGRDSILAQESLTNNLFKLIDVSGNRTEVENLTLPISLATNPAQTDAEPEFRMMAWDESDRLVLVEYRYPDYRGWILFDTRSPENSVNVSDLIDDPASVQKIMFDERNGRAFYVLSHGVIRRIDTSNGNQSAPLARNVSNMWQSNDGVVTYATDRDSEGYRTVGYYTRGASEARTLLRFESPESQVVSLVIGEYLGRQYAAIQKDELVQVYRLSLHSSDSRATLDLKNVAAITAPEALRTLAFSPHDRFVYVQYGASYTVYDIELDKMTASTVKGDEPLDKTLGWLDRYHLWSDRGERLRWYEFDGQNAQDVTAVAPGFQPKITENNRYLYVVQRAADGKSFALVQVQLRIE